MSDIEIARNAKLEHITNVAKKVGITEEELELYDLLIKGKKLTKLEEQKLYDYNEILKNGINKNTILPISMAMTNKAKIFIKQKKSYIMDIGVLRQVL